MDFNENLLIKKKTPLLDLMSSYRYTQIVTKPTTDQGSLLDHVYINEVNICHTVDILDTYYSDHDAVLLTLCFCCLQVGLVCALLPHYEIGQRLQCREHDDTIVVLNVLVIFEVSI